MIDGIIRFLLISHLGLHFIFRTWGTFFGILLVNISKMSLSALVLFVFFFFFRWEKRLRDPLFFYYVTGNVPDFIYSSPYCWPTLGKARAIIRGLTFDPILVILRRQKAHTKKRPTATVVFFFFVLQFRKWWLVNYLWKLPEKRRNLFCTIYDNYISKKKSKDVMNNRETWQATMDLKNLGLQVTRGASLKSPELLYEE